jgi:hypothetical protein
LKVKGYTSPNWSTQDMPQQMHPAGLRGLAPAPGAAKNYSLWHVVAVARTFLGAGDHPVKKVK